ncbi:aminoacyl-tRNA hydrolase [Putridiphycobacter roseus]|uniref:Aminoacyl-tRNA hydrolase n=1 Tax=Putridiphycobacter roseus TaxID=2219161 RepID=A0A2W1N1S3_9FLAO|nr:alternative ribosome rescue aminoacyl-tRNA hydrolase ArfB [Putridiphycobacter roseus]PZE17510.1 aminoacyl-tRNA hydrolase [Putridiphycobacter roseus]
MHLKTLLAEIKYKAVRSSGAGGQHVNKVATKVVLFFNLIDSEAFNETEKYRLMKFFEKDLSQEGILQFSASESRSQFKNKKIAHQKLLDAIGEGLRVNKVRRKSKPSRSSVLKGKVKKKRLSDKKKLRKRPEL